MFEDVKNESTNKVNESANNFVEGSNYDQENEPKGNKKKILIIVFAFILIVIIVFGVWYLLGFSKNETNSSSSDKSLSDNLTLSEDNQQGVLSDVHLSSSNNNEENNNQEIDNEAIEYLSFNDFYSLPEDILENDSFNEYNLPINIKVDTDNYYEVSRKLNIDEGLDSLNNKAFAVIDNPWSEENLDFYAINRKLNEEGIPLYLSADFISYYYQNILKQSFKDVEEGVFYESLWNISESLYEQAKTRYEAHLALIGNVNNRILEGERLEAAFFAVSLELLKPQIAQVDIENKFDTGYFTPQDQRTFSFSVPAYLTDDVLRELDLIRDAKEISKSPVLLYDRDYENFIIPLEYKNNARLQNFYLAGAWLNSVFPLNYRDANCPDCLLDQDDWRINFTAASLISQDFANNQELKNEWARVYKTIFFFKGLRSSWSYVDYRDNLNSLFGENYDVTTLFAEENEDSDINMESLRQSLLQKENIAMQGALNLKTVDGYSRAGLQFLADFYWPNDFIFSSLSYPEVGLYLGENKLAENNVTVCRILKNYQRCQGSSQDILSLIYPDWQSEDFLENANYANYAEALNSLRFLTESGIKNNLNNYWSSLFLWQSHLNSEIAILPNYLRSDAWREQGVISAAGAWIDMQLPLDTLKVNSINSQVSNLAASISVPDYAWVEPNLSYFDHLLAYNEMILEMFKALGLDSRSSLAANRLSEASLQINSLRSIATKQAQGIALDSEDNKFIRDFASMYLIEESSTKTLLWHNKLGTKLKETLKIPRLIIVAHVVADKIVLAVGPVFNYLESN